MHLIFDYAHWQALISIYEMVLFIKQINTVDRKKILSFKLVLIIKSSEMILWSLFTTSVWHWQHKKKQQHERKYDCRSKSELFSDCVEHVVKQVIKFKRAKNKKKITVNKNKGRARPFIVMIRGFVVVVKKFFRNSFRKQQVWCLNASFFFIVIHKLWVDVLYMYNIYVKD